MIALTRSARLRTSPYYQSTLAEGLVSAMPYNNMILPLGYGDPVGEYWRLINGVSMWDVAVERQVQLQGPDAARLAQMLCPRDLSKCVVNQGKYAALCNHNGILINDPILLKLDDDRFWLSIADSNILFWARAIAAERKLDVTVTEPDVSPLAVQGPKAEDVIAHMFGDWTKKLGYFWFKETRVESIPVVVARSGWSKQGGFELYLMDGSMGDRLWQLVKEAGARWDIGPGNPNPCERIESGLLSWGGDTDDTTNPYEVRLGKYIDLDVPDDVIGIEALRKIHAAGPARHQLGVALDGDAPLGSSVDWADIRIDGRKVGDMTCGTWSYRLEQNIGFALVASDVAPGTRVTVVRPDGSHSATLQDLPFI